MAKANILFERNVESSLMLEVLFMCISVCSHCLCSCDICSE